MNTTFNSLDTATQGLLSNNSFTTSIQGFLTFITIEPPNIPGGISIGGIQYDYQPQKPQRKTTKITVTCIKNGEEFKQTKYIKKVNIKVEDINVKLNEGKISIKVIS